MLSTQFPCQSSTPGPGTRGDNLNLKMQNSGFDTPACPGMSKSTFIRGPKFTQVHCPGRSESV
eukprot:716285-Rhodomonas_salina.1